MNIKFKKLMSVLLCCVMLFGMLPVNAFANVTGEQSGIVLEENIPEAPVDEVIPSSDEPVIPPVEEPLVEELPVEEPPVVPVEDEPVMEEEVPEEEVTSRFEEFKVQIEELQAQAKELDQNSDSFEAESEVLLEKADAFDNAVSTAYEDGILSEDEYNALSQMSADFYQIVFADENDNQVEDATVYYDLLQKYYKGNSKVYWDVMASHTQGGDNSRIASVTLGGKDVVRAESDSTNWSGGNALSTYYPNASSRNNGETKTLKITPVEGYYVTEVVVACSIGQKPYRCNTWSDGNAFTKTFSLTAEGFAECDLHSKYFGHASGQMYTPTYFILINTAPLPSPMYIEYDCGEMETILDSEYADSIFQDPNGWTAESAGNNKGSAGVIDTEDTQYQYCYKPNDESNVTQWKHNANTVTEKAKLLAAEKGYYFAGWAATYYNTCTVANTADDAGNNKTYAFSNEYSNNAVVYDEGGRVALTTHVQLVAQWEPVKMTVQKVVNGLTASRDHTLVVKRNGIEFDTVTFNGAGSNGYSPVLPGTYSVEEVGANQPVLIGDKYYDLATAYSASVEVTASAIAAGSLKNVALTVTNNYSEVTTIDIPVTKRWEDADNQDGVRPASVTVKLLANGVETGDTMVLSDSNNWFGTFMDLEQFGENGAIVYSVTEAEVDNYIPSIDGTQEDGFVITNKHTPEQIRVTITKEWNDANNQDGKRPTSITAGLYADGVYHSELTITAEENWTKTINDLPKYAAGKEIVYTVKEINVPDGYTANENGLTITNSYQPAVVSVSGTKTWNDNNDQDGIRPTSITVNLLANGVKVDSQTVNAKDEWKYTFADLDKYEAGKEIVYTVTEETVEGYTTGINGNNITNTHTPATIEISVSKVWDDAENQDGIRPASVIINLLANGTKVASEEVTAANGWAGTFKDLPKFENGKEIKYTVEESTVPEGYTASVDGFRIKNTHAPEKTSVSGAKTWNDNNDQDGIRPASITVNLLANGEKIASRTVNAKDEWKYSFSDLDKYKAGQEIEYTMTEETVEGYTTGINGYNITNTHTPETIEISVSKAWDDAENQDGIRPTSVTINLLANGTKVASKEVTAADGWTGTFENLPKFENGKEIKYSVEESVVPEGYTASVDGFQIKNTHAPAKTSVAVSKVWADAENQDGIRPASVTIELMADGQPFHTVILSEENEWTHVFSDLDKYADGEEIEYTVKETSALEGYTVAISEDENQDDTFRYTVTNTHAPAKTSVAVSKAWDDADNQDGKRPAAVTINLLANGEKVKSLSLNATNDWQGEFTELDKFAAGVEIVYTVSEDAVADYNTENENGLPVITGNASTGYTVTNTHVPETVVVSGQKTWVDADNQDGKRPASITINLLADGEKIASKTVTEADGWKWSFENLPKYKVGAVEQEVAYAITEDNITDYSASINGYDVTNTHTPAKTSVTVTKVWKDAGNQDGIRPNDITITLLADGVDTGKTLTLNSGNWTGSFTGLDVYKAGKEIVYTVQEQAVSGYTTQITGTAAAGFVVTNTHTPAVIAVEGSKIWDDADDHDGFRPDTITINLLADGEKIASKTVKETDDWKWSFKDLPKYKVGAEGKQVVYTISEDKVERYTTEIDGYDVTNSYTPQKTAVAVNKVWLDENDQDGIRPNHITVKLLADGVATEKTLVLSVGNNWNGSFTDLDKYKDGKEIVYTVEELKVDGYTSAIGDNAAGGYTVTNTHTPAVVTVSGAKTWEDHKNQDGKRPDSITIRLLADGKEIKVIEVNEAAEWKWTIENLPKFAAGKEIVYTITEDAVEGYTADIKDFNVTNTHNPAKTTVTVTKVWEDSNDQDGLRPESVTINLLANGEKVKSHKIKEDDKWTYTFEKLDKFENGKEIVYTVTEEAVEGYNTVITGDAGKGFTVTNSHTPEVMDIAGTKTWDDGNNQDGKRPDAITVNLLANGKVIDTVKVTSAEKWTYLFTNLPKFEAGEEIIYTVTEDAVEDYTTTYDGYNIINKYTPKKTSITVTKRWVDGHNHDGIRPNSVKVILYANGKPVDTMRLSEKHNWTGVFKNLPVYQNGEPIKYTLQEKSVSGYNATITGNARKGFIVTNTHNIIPKTGDESNLPLYTGLFGAGFSAMAVLLFLAKPRKKGKYTR